ncbi:MAG TPA: hypothetical protein VGZ93_12900 [Candidatus Methylacidiphilales bacterium]|nr:hypothetical protein [Candidatus Methylacidiphilales bacterium]
MKKRLARLLPALALLFVSSLAARADQFTQLQNSPYVYWVPAPTPPPPGYVAAPRPPVFYGGPPPPAVHFFFGFHYH